MSNRQRAAIIAFAQSVFPVLVMLGVPLSNELIGAFMLLITNGVTLAAFIFPGPAEVVEVEVAAPEPVNLLHIEPAESTSVIKP